MYSLVAADFNGDGRTDLAVSTHIGVSILLGNGDGTFQLRLRRPSGITQFSPRAILIGMAVPTWPSCARASYRYFSAMATARSKPSSTTRLEQYLNSIVAGDFNGDGITDLVASTDSGVLVLLGTGDGDFRPQETNLGTGAGNHLAR